MPLKRQFLRIKSINCIMLFSQVQHFATPRTSACQASLSFTISQSLLNSIELAIQSKHLKPCHPFFSCPQSFPASGSFPMSQLFESGGQSIGASALVLLMNIQGWFPFRLTGLISLLAKASEESSPAPQYESIHTNKQNSGVSI